MKYRQLKTDFWEDGYILDLTRDEKLLFIYLFTNPKVNMCGIYELPDRTICYTLDLTLEQLGRLKTKFSEDHKFLFHKGWVFICNYAQHNIYSAARPILFAFEKEFNLIPPDIKKYFFAASVYEFPIKDFERYFNHVNDTVTVKDNVNVNVNVKYPRPYPRDEANDEFIDPDTVPL